MQIKGYTSHCTEQGTIVLRIFLTCSVSLLTWPCKWWQYTCTHQHHARMERHNMHPRTYKHTDICAHEHQRIFMQITTQGFWCKCPPTNTSNPPKLSSRVRIFRFQCEMRRFKGTARVLTSALKFFAVIFAWCGHLLFFFSILLCFSFFHLLFFFFDFCFMWSFAFRGGGCLCLW